MHQKLCILKWESCILQQETMHYFCQKSNVMITMNKKVALLVRLEAKAGKEQEVADFIERALPLAQAEEGTISWYALQIGTRTFGIFDTFPHQEARQEHLAGEIARAIMAKADELLSQPPVIEKVKVLACK